MKNKNFVIFNKEDLHTPENMQNVVVYYDNDNAVADIEKAIYLTAGTELFVGVNNKELKGNTPEERLMSAINGDADVSFKAPVDGFYVLDIDDLTYSSINPKEIAAWAAIPMVELKESIQDKSVAEIGEFCSQDCIAEFFSKKEFTRDVAFAFAKQKGLHSIKDVDYKVFYNQKHGWVHEDIVITYNGGAIAVRNNSGNSITATFESICQMVNGGYYVEVGDYQERLNDPDWSELKF